MALTRTRRLSMLISDEEWEKLQALAEAEGITASDYVRMFVRRAHAERFGEKKPKTKK
jgi:hypothetical protein